MTGVGTEIATGLMLLAMIGYFNLENSCQNIADAKQ
jgi:hypothetical protein